MRFGKSEEVCRRDERPRSWRGKCRQTRGLGVPQAFGLHGLRFHGTHDCRKRIASVTGRSCQGSWVCRIAEKTASSASTNADCPTQRLNLKPLLQLTVDSR